MDRVQVTTQKAINSSQLKAELGGADVFTSEDGIVEAEGVTEAQLQAAVAAHEADSEWRPPGPERDWRVALQNEIAFIESQLSSWPANATTNTEGLQRVNFLLAAVRRLARDQVRILRFIRDNTLDAGA